MQIDWVTNWLTPVWLLGVGGAGGMLLVAILWFVGMILSRLPGLGVLDNVVVRQRLVLVVTIVGVCLLVPVALLPAGEPLEDRSGLTPVEMYVLAVLGGWLAVSSLICLGSRRAVDEMPDALREGPIWPIIFVVGAFALFGLFGTFVVRAPQEFVESLTRLHAVGTVEYPAVTIPGRSAEGPNQYAVGVRFERKELKRLTVISDENLVLATEPRSRIAAGFSKEIVADESIVLFDRDGGSENPFVDDTITRLYVQAISSEPAQLRITVATTAQHPEVWTAPITAICVLALFLVYFVQRNTMPKLSAVALSTVKSDMAQPLFMILLLLGGVLLFFFVWIPYNTFGEDIKVLKDTGMTLIMIICIVQAVWSASTSVFEELEGRTALTVLSKPINRRSFIIGKFVGINWTVALLFIVLGAYFLVLVAYKPIHDARESSGEVPTFELIHLEMMRAIPGLLLAFLETVVIAAVSVAISTRLNMYANILVCFAIYVLGHMTPVIVQSSVGRFAPVAFVGKLIGVICPNLNNFNIQAAIAAGRAVPPDYLGWAFAYCLVYTAAAMFLALVLFEDRDLA